MSPERRRIERVHLIHYLRVFHGKTGALIGNLVNINAEGIKLICEQRIPLGETYSMRMEFPEEVDGMMSIQFEGTALWCDIDINPDLYAVGFHLDSIKAAELQVIHDLIDQYRDDTEG